LENNNSITNCGAKSNEQQFLALIKNMSKLTILDLLKQDERFKNTGESDFAQMIFGKKESFNCQDDQQSLYMSDKFEKKNDTNIGCYSTGCGEDNCYENFFQCAQD